MRETIHILYSCVQCGLLKTGIDVPARQGEDVNEWMDQTIECIAVDHHVRSPECQATTISDVMIPITGADQIGGPPVN